LRRGWLALMGALLRHDPVPTGRFVPEPGPAIWRLDAAGDVEALQALPDAA
jgi:hypothetical protein